MKKKLLFVTVLALLLSAGIVSKFLRMSAVKAETPSTSSNVAETHNIIGSQEKLNQLLDTNDLDSADSNTTEKKGDENRTLSTEEKREELSSDAEEPTVENRGMTRGTTAYVNDWASFVRAHGDVNVSDISLTQSFAVPAKPLEGLTDVVNRDNSNSSGGATYVRLYKPGIARKVVINGNGNTIDFGAVCLMFDDVNLNNGGFWDITYKNLKIFHGNYYGFTTLNDLNNALELQCKITYDNVTDVGNQMIHSPYTKVVVSGNTSNIQQATYTSPFRTNWAINNVNQTNMYITELTVTEGALFRVSTLNAGNIDLGNEAPGNLVLEKNAKILATANGTNRAGTEAQGTNILIKTGNIVLGEGALLSLTPSATSSAISMLETGANLIIGNGAIVTVNSKGHVGNDNGAYDNLIRMAAGSSLIVDEGGIFNVYATGMGTSNSNIIHVAGNANFIVKKKGTFSVSSDSTSQSQSLLYFGSNGSKFQFADAQRVDLIRKNTIVGTGTNNGLINIAGTGGILDVDIQKVSIWSRDNLSDTPTSTWTPMYGMSLKYTGVTPEVVTVSSLTTANETAFRTGFTTKNTQRVLFEYIPDVQVGISSVATDLVSSNSSTTVSGVATPNSFVRISDIHATSQSRAAINSSQYKVPSPVTSIEAPGNYRANFTLVATDVTGAYSYTVPEGKHFEAGSKIVVFAFLNGKEATATQVVADATPPKGYPREYHAGFGEAVPNPKWFVQNPTDTNPIAQNFTYAYSAENSVTDIQAMLSSVGEHTVYVDLFDNAKNKTTIASKLIVHGTATGVDATNIEIGTTQLSGMTDAQLRKYILENSQASGRKYVDGVYTDLTDKISISNLGGLTPTSVANAYNVTMTIPKSASGLANDLTKSITVTVVNRVSVLTVNFVNEINQILPGYTVTVDGIVGDKIDLTKTISVTNQLANLQTSGYKIVERPVNETALELSGSTMTVQYKVQGVISLSSVPDSFGFGSLDYEATTKRVENPTIDKQLVVTDTRADTSTGFTMTATLSKPMINSNGKQLVNALRYVYKGQESILSADAQKVYVNSSGTAGNYTVSDTWGNSKGTDGVKLQIDSSDVIYSGDYTGVITWKVMAGQP